MLATIEDRLSLLHGNMLTCRLCPFVLVTIGTFVTHKVLIGFALKLIYCLFWYCWICCACNWERRKEGREREMMYMFLYVRIVSWGEMWRVSEECAGEGREGEGRRRRRRRRRECIHVHIGWWEEKREDVEETRRREGMWWDRKTMGGEGRERERERGPVRWGEYEKWDRRGDRARASIPGNVSIWLLYLC